MQAALRAQPGTLHYVAEADDEISILGLSDHASLIAFGGDANWTGYAHDHWPLVLREPARRTSTPRS